jgi:Rieske Fe-S protein
MDRREFVKHSCMICLGGGLLSVSLTGCVSTHYVAGVMRTSGIAVPKSEFTYIKKGQAHVRSYIIVQNEKLEFPIYLYRFSENEFSALWMKCTHQGAELQASGDYLHCPSHGSEFDNRGMLSEGPAEKNLRTFPVSVLEDTILIDLQS